MTEELEWDAGLAPAARKRARRPAAATASTPVAPDPRVADLEREVRALREEVARGHERIEALLARPAQPLDDDIGSAITTLQSDVALMASRLSTLLGGPTLTELLDRIDELADQLPSAEGGRRRKR